MLHPTMRFDGRVAVVTGAGRGLGRAYALAFAERGASVVVNDVTGSDGTRPADEVVSAIAGAGGNAVASHHDVADPGDAVGIVATALDAFGAVDIVVNNAGIGHVGAFEEPVDKFLTVVTTNLLGAAYVTRAAWPHFRRARHGRVVLTTSAVGLWGATHSAAYATAKAGLVGLARSLALEGADDDIVVNCVAPAAQTRLTEGRFPRPGSRRWRPELVVPAVLYLSHESCALSGKVLSAFSGLFSLIDVVQGRGHRFDPRLDVDVEDFVMRLDEITNMDGATSFADGDFDALGTPLGVDLRDAVDQVGEVR